MCEQVCATGDCMAWRTEATVIWQSSAQPTSKERRGRGGGRGGPGDGIRVPEGSRPLHHHTCMPPLERVHAHDARRQGLLQSIAGKPCHMTIAYTMFNSCRRSSGAFHAEKVVVRDPAMTVPIMATAREEALLACAVPNWHPEFSSLTHDTRIVRIPDELAEWIVGDNLSVPGDSAAVSVRLAQGRARSSRSPAPASSAGMPSCGGTSGSQCSPPIPCTPCA